MRLTRTTWLTVALLAAVVVAGPVLDAMGQSYWLIALTRALLLSVLAVATNLAWGITGIFTLGQAVFFGFGAYAAGLLATKTTVTSTVFASRRAVGVWASTSTPSLAAVRTQSSSSA